MGDSQEFRSAAAQVNSCAPDRPDPQHGSRNIAAHVGADVPAQDEAEEDCKIFSKSRSAHSAFLLDKDLRGCAGSDGTGSKRNAKSERHLLKSRSTGQSTIALPSGEAELYALAKVVPQMLGIFQ